MDGDGAWRAPEYSLLVAGFEISLLPGSAGPGRAGVPRRIRHPANGARTGFCLAPAFRSDPVWIRGVGGGWFNRSRGKPWRRGCVSVGFGFTVRGEESNQQCLNIL